MQTATQPTFDTMKFIPPTLEQVKARATEIELPNREAEKFFHYYEANGWRTGRTKIQRWMAALTGWKLRWEENKPKAAHHNGSAFLNRAQIDHYNEELKQVKSQLAELKYNGTTYGWTPKLKEQWYKLIARKNELKRLLGITV